MCVPRRQAIAQELDQADDSHQHNHRAHGHILLKAVVPIADGKIPKAARSHRPGHGRQANQADGSKRRSPHQWRNAFTQIDLENHLPGTKAHGLSRFNNPGADFRQG